METDEHHQDSDKSDGPKSGIEEENDKSSNQSSEYQPKSGLNGNSEQADKHQIETESLRKEFDLLKKADESNIKQLQYIVADYSNFRKQMEKQAEDAIEAARINILSKIIEAQDDFLKLLGALKINNCPPAIVDGLTGVQKNLESILRSEGVQEIESMGRLFDPDIHDPVGFSHDFDKPENTVVQVRQKGYLLNNKILRPSSVILSKGKPRQTDVSKKNKGRSKI